MRQIVDAAGIVQFAQSYEPYGDVLISVGIGDGANYGFAGEWTDASGMQFLRARYYQTGIGRFLARDTWAGNNNWPQSLNRWGYVEGNPVRYTDPSGMVLCDSIEPLYYAACLRDNDPSFIELKEQYQSYIGYEGETYYRTRAIPPKGIRFNPDLPFTYPEIIATRSIESTELSAGMTNGQVVQPGTFQAQFQDYDSDGSLEFGVCGLFATAAAMIPGGNINDIFSFVVEANLTVIFPPNNPGPLNPNYTWLEELEAIAAMSGWKADIFRLESSIRGNMTLRDSLNRGHYPVVGVPINGHSGIINPEYNGAHWVLVLGISESYYGSSSPEPWFRWIKYYNSFNHQIEYLPEDYFVEAWFSKHGISGQLAILSRNLNYGNEK